MKMKKVKRQKSIIYSWLMSYIAVLLIPLLLGVLFYFTAKVSMVDEIHRSNRFLLQQIQTSSDELFSEIQRLNTEIGFSQQLDVLLKAQKPLNSQELNAIIELNKKIKIYNTSNRPLDNYYLYIKSLDLVFDPSRTVNSTLYYSILDISDYMTIWQWRDMVLGGKTPRCVPIKRRTDSGEVLNAIAFVQPLPISAMEERSAASVIVIDENTIFRNFKNNLYKQSELLIVDHGNVLLSLTDSDKYKSLDIGNILSANGDLQKNIGKEKVIVSHIASDKTSWQYILITPYDEFWGKLQNMTRVILIIISLFVILSGFVIRFFLKKNYGPVNRLIDMFDVNSGMRSDRTNNEFSLIEQMIENTVKEKEKMTSYLEQQNKILKQNYLARILKGKIDSETGVEEHLRALGISFLGDSFVVMLIFIDDINHFFSEETDLSESEKIRLAQFIISNVMGELLNNHHQAFFIEIDEVLACITNLRSFVDIQKQLESIVMETQQFVRKHFDIIFTVSISRWHNTIIGISEAYSEAVTAMEYKILLGTQKIIHYEDIDRNSQNNYYYPIEKEQLMINNIKIGNFNVAKQVLDDVFKINFKDRLMPIQIAKCLMFDMISTMLKTVSEIGNKADNDFIEDLLPIDTLMTCETMDEMLDKMTAMLYRFCEEVQSKNKNSLRNKVEGVVMKNYMDINLSISTIAEILGIHPTYLSNAFKEQAGEGLLEFIGKVRINKAKNLLITMDSNIEVIANSVGYANVRTFVRVFKKYEGVTPVKYKEMYEQWATDEAE